MKKLLLITIILLLQSFPSYGEWVEYFSDNEKYYYLEEDTVRRKDNIVYFNYLVDYLKPQSKDGYLSTINRHSIDCKNNLHKPLRITNYKRSMGRGKITFDYDSQIKWVRILDGTLYFHFKKVLCK